MRVLIVDDEKHVRDAIRILVDWESFGIRQLMEAEDGESAIRIIADEQPDLVFTDMMMPGIGGPGLLEWIQSHSPRTKTVVISGHDDFELVRTAVKCGGLDYILKPIDPGELQAAVHKAVDSRRREEVALLEQQQRNMEVNQIKPVYWDRMLSNLMDDPGYFDKLKQSLSQELGYTPDCVQCRAAVISLASAPADIIRKFSSAMDLLYFTLINICNEYLRGSRSGYAFRPSDGQGHIVLLFWRNLSSAEEQVRLVHEGMVKALKCRLDFGLGFARDFPQGLGAAYQEAVSAHRTRNLLKRTSWLHVPAAEPTRRKTLPFGEYEERFRMAIRSTKEEQVDSIVDFWFEQIRVLTFVNSEQLEHWKQEYYIFRSRFLKELPGEDAGELEPLTDTAFSFSWNDNGTLSLPSWKQQLRQALVDLSVVYRKHLHEDKHVIFEIAKFIEAHYREDITLQDIADRYFLSREYISRKFKQEFKENLSDFIGRIRIEKAKLLLLNPDCRVAQAAEQVGYQDEKYFSKVFKKLTGLTPGEYRKNQTSNDG
jgi:two-component system, response regulator YesN